MPLQKQVAPINFSQGLDLKTDQLQIPMGKFLDLQNSVFKTGLSLVKRNGFGLLASLPDTTSTYVTTFAGNLTAIGTSLRAYSAGSQTWVSRGSIVPCGLAVLPTVRSNNNQTYADTVVASNNFACTVYTDVGGSTTYKYTITDSTTGQVIVSPTNIPAAGGAIQGSPRVFLLGQYFVIVITNLISAVNHLQYLTIPITNPQFTPVGTDISTQYTPNASVAFDGVVANNNLYIAWNGNDGGGAIRAAYLTSTLQLSSVVSFATYAATMVSVCANTSGNTPVIYVSFYTPTGTKGYVLALSNILGTIFAPQQIISSGTVLNITATSTGSSGVNIFYEVNNVYSYGGGANTNFLNTVNVTAAGSVGSTSTIVRSVGLASKAFLVGGTSYMLSTTAGSYQPSYFLINGSGSVVAKLAYQNGYGFYTTGLPSVLQASDNSFKIAYLFKILIVPVNKSQGASQTAGIYAQTGVNLASFTIGGSFQSVEIGNNLHLSGGLLWAFDGSQPVEQNFNLYPDVISTTVVGSGGSMSAQQYYYQVVYEWSDNQGNIHQSAPSIPVGALCNAGSNSVTIKINTLRLTYKTSQPIKIVIYRWSTAQQSYYQITSVSSPTYNDTTVDNITYTDTQADSSIIGNRLVYTTGGVVEDIGPPACSALTLYRSRLFLVDAEDTNLLWYSKQVIEGTPVEMSDLFTFFVAPTVSAQGPTGGMTALSTMDDKLIIFKKNAIYYITGNGPDNTGANNDFSDPIFVSSAAGCTNPSSVVITPAGIMFQSDKGIWLLGRDLSTKYIGAPVESFNSISVIWAVVVPGTNQVRFGLSNGIVLMYDYYYEQWGTFTGIPSLSSTLYQNLHTFINAQGLALQEAPGTYTDNGTPVQMKFTTGWLHLAGLEGFQRAYMLMFLATYYSPHNLTVSVAYDYSASIVQQNVINPTNFTGTWGADTLWGGGIVWGGPGQVEQWKMYLQKQKCQAIQVTLQETYDSSLGVSPGQGLTLSGMNLIYGVKSAVIKLTSAQSVG